MAKAHDLYILGEATVEREPTQPHHVVRKADLDSFSSSVSGPIFVTGVSPVSSNGNVGDFVYADTVPENQVVTQCSTDVANVTLHFLAAAGNSYSPKITCNGVQARLQEHPTAPRMFLGEIDLTLQQSGDVVLQSDSGSTATVRINVSLYGPGAGTLQLNLDEDRLAFKHEDVINFSGTIDNSAQSVVVLDQGAAKSGTADIGDLDSAGPGARTFTGQAVVSDRSGSLSLYVSGKNNLGTLGSAAESAKILLDQTEPEVSVAFRNSSSSGTALGFQDTVEAIVDVLNYDSVSVTFDNGSVAGTFPGTGVLTVDEEVYSVEKNVHVTATYALNQTTVVRSFDLPVASIVPEIEVTIQDAVMLRNVREVSGYPRLGSASSDPSIDNFSALSSTDNQTIPVQAPGNQRGYFAYPVALGRAMFIDVTTGNTGSWSEPNLVRYNETDWYLYHTLETNVMVPFQVTFQNPGLEVGAGTRIPHVSSSISGKVYSVRVTANQKLDRPPEVIPSAGIFEDTWQTEDSYVWTRPLRVRNVDSRGAAVFDLSASNAAGMPVTQQIPYAIAGFERHTITVPAFARSVAIGVTVFNTINTRARYTGTENFLELRTDTRDAAESYSVVNDQGEYRPSMGTHIWLSDADFAQANTSGTLRLDIEEVL